MLGNKVIPMVCLVVCLGLAQFSMAADPSLIGWWVLDDGTGDLVEDRSDSGIAGTLFGAPAWETDAEHGTVLVLDGTDDYVEILGPYELETYTLSLWFRFDGTPGGTGDVVSLYAVSGHKHGVLLELRSDGTMRYLHRAEPMGTGGGTTEYTAGTYDNGNWYHMAAVKTADTMTLYINGEVALTGSNSTTFEEPALVVLGTLGGTSNARYFTGAISDFRIYNRALAENEIPGTMVIDTTLADSPLPADAGDDVLRDAALTWSPGEFAVKHDVYFGESFDDVNAATVPTGSGLDVTSFDPGRLDFGTTYFWRVDEVNGAPDNTVFKGNVWSFEVEPYSIPIPGDTVAVTASSSSNEFSTPDKTTDGSGLGDNDVHAIASETMWFSAAVDLDPWIQYEFDGVKKLDIMKVWNSNGAAESAIGWGVKDVQIEYSVDGENWDVLEGVTQISRAPGSPTYNQYDEINFQGAAAQYVRLNIQSNWGGILMSYGLSEVQFSRIPVEARTPVPASGSVDVAPDSTVTWRSGLEAAEHTIYVSTDQNAVADGVASSVTTNTNSLDLGSLDLQLGQTYYWRVDEVNEAEAMSVSAGSVWSLSTPAALIVDDFEGYSNKSPNRPFQTWLDGFGYSADEFFSADYPGNGTGSGIGHDIWSLSSPHYDGSIMETTIVYGGSQSLPLYYDNTGGAASETQRTIDIPQDWTVGGIQSLSLMIYGSAGNTGQLYLKINNTRINGAPDISQAVWQAWIIDLSAVGGNLQNVTSLTIGVEGAGAEGMLYIDEMRLYPMPGELVVPTEPSPDGLVAYLSFDENSGTTAADGSGNNNHGDVMGDAQWVAGKVGGALAFDGVDDMVVVNQNSGLPIYNNGADNAFSVAMWVKGVPQNDLRVFSEGSATSNNPLFNMGTHNSGSPTGQFASYIRPDAGTVSNHPLSQAEPFDDTWHHIAWVDDNGTATLYVDGYLDGGDFNYTRGTMALDTTSIGGILRAAPSHFFTGQIDEVRVYSRALLAGEIMGLAGKTEPIHKPF
ncbi:MAG: discoidin domain-containing protein [Phycisphaeraceae bacterium]|nr:discoidin domain-containing protein [Phycisphaeraceae bacterium]